MSLPEVDAPRAGPRVVAIIPALNEAEALPLVLAEIPRGLVHEVIVVDNGSTDGTAEVASARGARVVREERRGYGSACLRGIAAAGDADVIVFLDGDHSDHPEDLERLLPPVLSGKADLAIGTRMATPESRRALLPQARWGNRLATLLMRLLFGVRATDLGPFRAISAAALRRLGMRDPDYGWTIEMQLRAHFAGLRVVEVPVRYRTRIGRSKITGTLRGSLGAARKILGTILRYRLRPPRLPGAG